MSESEIKLLSAKSKLLSEISNHKDQIYFTIKKGAKQVRETLQDGKTEYGATLTKVGYDLILNFLLSIERDAMYNFGDNKYLQEYYSSIAIKEDILKTL